MARLSSLRTPDLLPSTGGSVLVCVPTDLSADQLLASCAPLLGLVQRPHSAAGGRNWPHRSMTALMALWPRHSPLVPVWAPLLEASKSAVRAIRAFDNFQNFLSRLHMHYKQCVVSCCRHLSYNADLQNNLQDRLSVLMASPLWTSGSCHGRCPRDAGGPDGRARARVPDDGDRTRWFPISFPPRRPPHTLYLASLCWSSCRSLSRP